MAKCITVMVKLFTKGDLVRTPFGNGVVLEDEVLRPDFHYNSIRTVLVALNEQNSMFPHNRILLSVAKLIHVDSQNRIVKG